MTSIALYFNDMIAPLADVPTVSLSYIPTCEADYCDEKADVEFHYFDREDGSSYYTYRCADHPAQDAEYEENYLG